MISFQELLASLKAQGYGVPKARTKIAHDVILKAMSQAGLGRNVTIKGGVLMSDITGDIRRATMDMDIDFVRYSLADEQIEAFVERLNCIEGVKISRTGAITELKQRNYRGKRIFLIAEDASGVKVRTKIDIGVHVYSALRQQSRTFTLSVDANGAKMSSNSPEQVFCEKLKSLLRFGARSERPKDLFDMCYLSDKLDRNRLWGYIGLLIFADESMREKTCANIIDRLRKTFSSRTYLHKLARADANWLGATPREAVEKLLAFVQSLEKLSA